MGTDERTTLSPPTEKGRAMRARIVDAAAELIFERGVAEVSLDDIREKSGASKSQLYHYFKDKNDLLRAVIEHQERTYWATIVPCSSRSTTGTTCSDGVMRSSSTNCRGGVAEDVPLGSLASGLSELDDAPETS